VALGSLRESRTKPSMSLANLTYFSISAEPAIPRGLAFLWDLLRQG
jgi:hypothetical protein